MNLGSIDYLQTSPPDQPVHGFGQKRLVYAHFFGLGRFRDQFRSKIDAPFVAEPFPEFFELRHYFNEDALSPLDGSFKCGGIVPRPLPRGHYADVVAIIND